MGEKHLPVAEAAASRFLDEIALCGRKLLRFTKGLTQEELEWAPPGVNNSMSWILVHLATTLWVCHAVVTNTRMSWNPNAAGLALGSVRGIDYGKSDDLPVPSAREPLRYLDEALGALRRVLHGDCPELHARMIFADRKWRTAWWFLTHELGDFAYHTGQASYLRKIIGAERTRARSSPRR